MGLNRLVIEIPEDIMQHPDLGRLQATLGDIAMSIALGKVEFNLETIIDYIQKARLPINVTYERASKVIPER